MQIDKSWYKLYESMFGTQFNRLLTTGNLENEYLNYNIRNLDEIRELIDEGYPKNEFYISLYNYKTEENILRWDTSKINKYEQYAEKNVLLIRLKQDTHIIQEEINELSDIQKFMFIRRSINLGLNKDIVKECNKIYNFFKTHFNLKGCCVFNGFDECFLYYRIDELNLKYPSFSYYNLFKLLEEKLELKTLSYEKIEPFAQIVPLIGTQNNQTRLYSQFFSPESSYEEIMLKSQEKALNESDIKEFETSPELEHFIKDIDKRIHYNENKNKLSFDDIWNNI